METLLVVIFAICYFLHVTKWKLLSRTGGYIMNLVISFVVIGVPFLITAAIIEMFLKDMEM